MIDIFEIIEMSQDAEALLLNNKLGKIHSIYKNTINISLGRRIVSIHPNRIIKSPMSLRMRSRDIDLESLDLDIGDKVEVSKNGIEVMSYIFDFNNSRKWNASLEDIEIDFKKKHHKEYKIMKDTLKTHGRVNSLKPIVLSLIEASSIDLKEDDYFSSKVYWALEGFISGVEARDLDRCVDDLFKLLGLGIGLTPSGDDFIMGLMGVLVVSKGSNGFIDKLLIAIKERLNTSLDRTTFLSSELYYYILEDKYSSIFLDIFKSVREEEGESLKGSLLDLLDMGHSSGGDTLCGIVFGIDIVKAIDSCHG